MNNNSNNNKYQNITDLELDYKVKNQRFFMNALFLIVIFSIFFVSAIKCYMIFENAHADERLLIFLRIFLAIILVVLAIVLSIISKKIVLPSEVEQKKRIEKYRNDGINCQTSINFQEFVINKVEKKKVSSKIITATIGGKVAVALIFILALIAIILPSYVYLNQNYIISTVNETKKAEMLHNYIPSLYPNEVEHPIRNRIFELFTLVHPLILSGLFLFLALLATACTIRQRGRETRMRINEKLELNDNILIYSFTMPANRWYPQNGVTVVAIDLSHSKVLYDKRQERLIFHGNIKTKLIENGENPKSIAQMLLYPIDPSIKPSADGTAPNYVPDGTSKNNYFEIYNYFDPNLAKLLSLK